MALSALTFWGPWTAAQLEAQSVRTTSALRISEAPTIDGFLNDPVWASAPLIDGFVQMEPSEGRPVSERTEVRLLQDDDAFYVGAWLFDRDAASITSGQNLRDASLGDADAFLVILDTYLDRQNGFVFGTTPGGIEYDGQVSGEGQGGGGGGGRQQGGQAGGFNLNWDGSWEVATTRDANGWYAEIRIPFSTLRYSGGGPQDWGINFERRIRRNSEGAVWAPVPRQFNLYRLSLAGTVALEAPIRRVVSVSPYALAEGFRDYTVASPETDLSIKVGGDAKIGLNQSLTLDLTVNTDFAAAEVDDQQVNLTRFSLFFPEKRGFFLENASVFSVGASRSSELFFSRRIGLSGGREVPIRAGARLTGKVGDLQLGLMNIQTGSLDLTDPVTGDVTRAADANNYSVLRSYREFGNRTRLGAIFVSRLNTSDTDDYNLTGGIDGRLGIGEALTLDAWVGMTRTPDAYASLNGSGVNDGEYGFSTGLTYVTGDWEASTDYRQIGDAFNPEVGFVNRRGYRRGYARVLRHLRTPSVSWFREFRPHVSWEQYWSLDGFSESYVIHFDNHFAFENGAFFQLPGLNFTGEGLERPFEIRPGIVIPAGSYDNIEWEFRANTNRGKPLSLSGGWGLGGFYTGTRFGPNVTVVYRQEDRLALTLRANYFDVRLDEGDFTTAVVGLNASYSFSPRVYLQANVQYNDDTQDMGTNIRFGWLNTAGTGLLISFNDSEHLGDLLTTGFRSGPRARQLVIKYSQLLELSR